MNVAVADLVLNGHPVTSGQQVTITGPAAARQVSGRFTAAAPAGDRYFALTTPLSSAASYVQGEIVPAGGSWSATVSIGPNGSYPTRPDRVTIVLASPSVAATLASYEGRPGALAAGPRPALADPGHHHRHPQTPACGQQPQNPQPHRPRSWAGPGWRSTATRSPAASR